MSLIRASLHEHHQNGNSRIHSLVSRSIESPWRYAIDTFSTEAQEEFRVENLVGDVSEDCHAAVLYVYPNLVFLKAFAPSIFILPSWDSSESGTDGVVLQPSTMTDPCMIQLRSGDKFQLGTFDLKIEFERAFLPEPFSERHSTVVGSEDTESIDQDYQLTKAPSADPTELLRMTPVSPEAIFGLAAASAMMGNEDSQHWNPATLETDVFGCVRNESRLGSQKSPLVNPLSQKLDGSFDRSLETGTEEIDIVQALETHIKAEDTQNSKLRDADVLLGSASESQQVPSSPIPNDCSEYTVAHGLDRMDSMEDGVLQDSIRSTVRCETPLPAKMPVITEKTTTITSPTVDPAHADTAQPAHSTLGELAPIISEAIPVKATPSRPRKRQKQLHVATPKINQITRSTQGSIEPSPSISRSSGKRSVSTPMSQPVQQGSHKILFSSSTTVDSNKSHLNFLKKHGVEKVDNVNDCTILCIGKDTELKRTGKLVLAIAQGKDVVSDAWITSSYYQKRLLDPLDYFAKDDLREMEWGTSLKEAVERGRKGAKPFTGWRFNFTTTVKNDLGSGFAEIKSIAEHAGAVKVLGTPPKLGPEELPKTIVIASQNEDKHLPALQSAGWRVFTKDIITLSVIRGVLDVESDEFLVGASKGSQANSKKRKR